MRVKCDIARRIWGNVQCCRENGLYKVCNRSRLHLHVGIAVIGGGASAER